MGVRRAAALSGLLLAARLGASWAGPEDVSVFRPEAVIASSHFRLHHQAAFAPAGILNDLEGLHAKLRLDLGVFAPEAAAQRIDIYLYTDAENYARWAHMPPWAAAHINYGSNTIFGYPSADLRRTLAHELGHYFFMRYFAEKNATPPTWLNEGVAMLMEWDYGGSSGDRDRGLSPESAAPLSVFFRSTYQGSDASQGRAVSQWYAQAGSVTRYLLRRFSPAQFARFCARLRDGETIDASLAAAYGLAVPDTAALDRLWRAALAEDR